MPDVKLLLLTAEPCPTFRADVAALFGRWLPRRGIGSDIVAAKAPQHSGEVVWGGGRALLCDVPSGKFGKHLAILGHSLRLLFGASRQRYDAIQARDMPFLGAVALLAARLRRLSFYYWMSYPMPEGHLARADKLGLSRGLGALLRPWLRGRVGMFLLYRVVLRWADHVFVTSDRMKADLCAAGVDPAKITAVPMGVDLEALQHDELVAADDARLRKREVLVYLGTLDPVRSIEVLFDMLVKVRRERPEVLLLLVGDTLDPAHRDWLRQRAREVGAEGHVIWTGWLPTAEAWRYVKAGHVGLSPFPRGPLLDSASPTKVAEYLAVGLPVVCNDNPDQSLLITESGAGLCVPYDAESFARAVLELLGEAPGRRAERVASGRRLVQSVRSYEVLSRQVADVYRSLQAAGEPPRSAPIRPTR